MKRFRGGANRNGLRYMYKGCYKLDLATLPSPDQYRTADGKEMLHVLDKDSGAFGVQTCADRCKDFLFMSLPNAATTHAHWTQYHTRYFQIAAKPLGPGLFVAAPCEPAQWLRDNFAAGRPFHGHGFYINRGVTGNECIVIDKTTVQGYKSKFLSNDATWLDFSSRGNLFLPFATEFPQRSVDPHKTEFFGLALGSQCLCMPSFPPFSPTPNSQHREPNGMSPLAQTECDSVCADGLSSCGSGLKAKVFSMYILDDRGLPTTSDTDNGAPGFSTSIAAQALGRSCYAVTK